MASTSIESTADEGQLGRISRYFLDDQSEVVADAVTIRGQLAQRIGRVMRAKRDDPLDLIDAASDQLLRAQIVQVARDELQCGIISARPITPLQSPTIALVVALIRPQRFDFMIEKVTELGVDTIQPMITERTIVRGNIDQRLDRWRRIATEASEQCRRERRPIIAAPARYADVLHQSRNADGARLLASAVEPKQRIAPLIADRRREDPASAVQLMIGPEGGLTPDEADAARRLGWLPISLGDRPLRAETAAIAAVALCLDAARS